MSISRCLDIFMKREALSGIAWHSREVRLHLKVDWLFSRRIAPCIFAGVDWHSSGNLTAVTFINDYFKLLRDSSVIAINAGIWVLLAESFACIHIRRSHQSIFFQPKYIICLQCHSFTSGYFIFCRQASSTIRYWHSGTWIMHPWNTVAVTDQHHCLHTCFNFKSNLPGFSFQLDEGAVFTFTRHVHLLTITLCCNQVTSCTQLAEQNHIQLFKVTAPPIVGKYPKCKLHCTCNMGTCTHAG